MYRKYISVPDTKTIFQSSGSDEGSVDTQQSPLYKKYFVKGNIEYLGRANRRRPKPNKNVVNRSFSEFLEQKNVDIECTHKTIIRSGEGEYKSASKYDKHQPCLNEKAWEMSKEWTIRHFGPGKMAGSVVSDFDTVWTEMDKQTSPGWPHNMVHKTKSTMVNDTKHIQIVHDYFDMIGRQQEEQEWKPVWMVSQKPELRPLVKIEENSIRTFTASPVEHSVALNRLCLDMNNRFYNSHGKSWSFVGGNKFHGGFHELHRRLSKHPNAFELDESQFDSSLFARALADMVDIRFEFLQEEDKTVINYNRLLNLYESIIHTVMIMENGELLRKHTGNPSGSANTIVDNTIILFRLKCYAWIMVNMENYNRNRVVIKTMGDANVQHRAEEECELFGTYEQFMANVEAALNGDDDTFTVSDKWVDKYNADTVAEVWSAIGITTNTPNNLWHQKVEDTSFLSQQYRRINNMWLPAPVTGKVYSSLMYGTNQEDVRWDLLRACALRVDSWANVETRAIIKRYIEFLWENYADIINSDGDVCIGKTVMKMADIRNTYKTDEWIWKLYSNKESISDPVLDIYNSLALDIEEGQSKEIIYFPKTKKQNLILKMSDMVVYKKKKAGGTPKKKVLRIPKKYIKNYKKSHGLRRVNIKGIGTNGQRIRGRGDYSVENFADDILRPFNDATPSVGMVNKAARFAGNAIGDWTGLPGAGHALGNASSWISRAFGFGDYTVKSNSLMSGNVNIAQFKNHGDITFAHREFVMDVVSSTTFNNQPFLINPGNNTLFPWLSTIAKNFEQYEFLGLIFEFKTTSATAVGSTNTGLGTLIMATDYDVLDGPYQDKRAMEITDFATSAPPCASQVHPIECAPRQNVMSKLFIQPGNSVSAYPDDPRFSALGNFQIATTGVQAASTVGELWVSYHVRLIKPQLENATSGSTTKLHAGVFQPVQTVGPPVVMFTNSSQPGTLGVSLTGGQANTQLTCLSVGGIGTYMITYAGFVTGGTLLSPGSMVVNALGSAIINSIAYDSIGTPSGRVATFTGMVNNSANNIGVATATVSTTVIVTFSRVGDAINFPNPGVAATYNVWYDMYVAPYQLSFLSSSKGEKIGRQQEEMLAMIKTLLASSSKNEESVESYKTKQDLIKLLDSDGEDTPETIDISVEEYVEYRKSKSKK